MRALAEETGKAQAASNGLSASQDDLRQQLSESSAFGKDILGGFIRDLRDGKKASEALADALSKVGDRLLDVALNSLFDGPAAGSGGGLLGGLFSWLFARDGGWIGAPGRPGGAPARRSGGGRVHGPGGPTGDRILTLLSDGEHVTRAAMAKKYGPLLDMINSDALPKMADGGWISNMPPIRAPSAPRQSGRDHIDVSGAFVVQNGNLVPLITNVSGVISGRQVRQADKMVPSRIRSSQTRGV